MDLFCKSSKTYSYIIHIWVYFGINYTLKQFIVDVINYYAVRNFICQRYLAFWYPYQMVSWIVENKSYVCLLPNAMPLF